MSNFSFLEDQLIRSSLETKTDREIAELLERSVEEVIERLNELTNGSAADRNRDIELRKQEIEKERADKKTRKEFQQAQQSRMEMKKQERVRQLNLEEKRRVEKEKLHAHRKYPTLQRDWSQYRSVKVDRKTQIFIHKDDDPVAAVELYKLNESLRNRNKLLKED